MGGAVLLFDCVAFEEMDLPFWRGVGGVCRSIKSESPALRRLLPDPTAQPSTPNDPIYLRFHKPGPLTALPGDVRFVGTWTAEDDAGVLITKLFSVDSRLIGEAVCISPLGGDSALLACCDQDPSKYMLTARSRSPADASSRLRRTCAGRGSSRIAVSWAANVSTRVCGSCGLGGVCGLEDLGGVGGPIVEVGVIWGTREMSSSRSSLKKRRFLGGWEEGDCMPMLLSASYEDSD